FSVERWVLVSSTARVLPTDRSICQFCEVVFSFEQIDAAQVRHLHTVLKNLN
ncbi:hypothetical protein AVEN_4920-1, partial [Araneus ventricosus]